MFPSLSLHFSSSLTHPDAAVILSFVIPGDSFFFIIFFFLCFTTSFTPSSYLPLFLSSPIHNNSYLFFIISGDWFRFKFIWNPFIIICHPFLHTYQRLLFFLIFGASYRLDSFLFLILLCFLLLSLCPPFYLFYLPVTPWNQWGFQFSLSWWLFFTLVVFFLPCYYFLISLFFTVFLLPFLLLSSPLHNNPPFLLQFSFFLTAGGLLPRLLW